MTMSWIEKKDKGEEVRKLQEMLAADDEMRDLAVITSYNKFPNRAFRKILCVREYPLYPYALGMSRDTVYIASKGRAYIFADRHNLFFTTKISNLPGWYITNVRIVRL